MPQHLKRTEQLAAEIHEWLHIGLTGQLQATDKSLFQPFMEI